MDICRVIANERDIRPQQAEAAVKLIDEGCTIPFIARYRKEVTGSLNDEVLRNLNDRLTYLRNLEERKETILAAIKEQEKLTPELEQAIREAETQVKLEDLYRPYKQKRKTRAGVAKEAGLSPLAELILKQETDHDPVREAEQYINPEKKILTAQDALQGAMDIIAEEISEDPESRARIRELTLKKGMLSSAAKDPDAKSVYEQYYAFESPVPKMTGYRTLAINRGEKEKMLTVKIEAPKEEILSLLHRKYVLRQRRRDLDRAGMNAENPYTTPYIDRAIEDGYNRLTAPSIEREIRAALTEVFGIR